MRCYKVYPNWAYSENQDEKARVNRETYEKIKGKAIVKLINRGYNTEYYKVISNQANLTNDQLALIADGGNLCFGYRMEGKIIVIYID